MKRLISVLLVLASLAALFSGCSMFQKSEPVSAPTLAAHHLLHTVKDGSTNYYCWEDGVATMTDTYDASSVLYWENDIDNGIYYVKNSKGTVAMEQYIEITEAPPVETETVTVYDPHQGHMLEGIVTDTISGNTYYCWDDGTATMSEEYGLSGLTWTHPWGEKFFNVYNGLSDNGNVVYSEKTCSWCGNHKTFYHSYLRNFYDFSEEGLYLCESCHKDLVANYVKCSNCGFYYYKDFAIYDNGAFYCEKCRQP